MSESWHDDGRASRPEAPSDLFTFRFDGDVDEQAVQVFIVELNRFAQDRSRVDVLADVSRVTSFSAGARNLIVHNVRGVTFGAVAVVGASFPIRVLAILITKAFQALSKSSYPIKFFDVDAEARAWLREQRPGQQR